MRRLVLGSILVALAATSLAVAARAQEKAEEPGWRKLRPDAPAEPKAADYSWKEIDGWTPPSREDLEKLPWAEGKVQDAAVVGRERAAKIKPACTVEEALKLRNESDVVNEKIMSALCQPPMSDDEVDWDATFNRHSASPNTLNPILNSSAYETYMNTLHGAGPFTFDHEMQPFADADVVKRWRRAEKDLVDLVELRDDITWDDGTPFTAYDIEFSYHVIMDPKVAPPAARSGVENMRWVKAYDAHTVAYFHKDALVTNVWNLNFSIIPKHLYKKSLTDDPTMKKSEWHAYWNHDPLALGPYRLKEWVTSEHVTFERREEWYQKGDKQVRKRPYLKYIKFHLIEDTNVALLAMKKGEIDDMILTARQWVQQTNDDDFYRSNTKVRGPEGTYFYISLNMRPKDGKKGFFQDKNVRLALATALNLKKVIKDVFQDLYPPCVGPFSPESPWGSREAQPIKHSIKTAEKLLDDAGWKKNEEGVREKDGQKFEFTILAPAGGTGPAVSEIWKQDLQKIGVILDIKQIEFASYLQKVQDHDFEAGVAAWGAGADPDSSKNIWKTEMYEKGRNYVGYSNPHVDELFDKGEKEFDLEKRRKIYQEISKTVFDDVGYIFLVYRGTTWGFSKDCRGYNFSPRGIFSYGPGTFQIWKPKKTR